MPEPQLISPPSQSPFHVAIVAWQALPAVIPSSGRNIGGLETAAWLIARRLASSDGVGCSLFVRSERPLAANRVEGVDLVVDVDAREYVRRDVSGVFQDGVTGAFRRLCPRLLWQLPYLAITWPTRRRDPAACQPDPRLDALRPDAWIAMGVSRESAGVVATAMSQGRPCVLMIRSNADLDPRFANDPTFRNQYGETSVDCLFAIRNAERVVCQTNHQLKLLSDSFDRKGDLLRNAIDIERWTPPPLSGDAAGEHVLWIGRYDRFHKRPHLAMAIADRCSEIPFRMIINPSDARVQHELERRCPANVTIDSYVPPGSMPEAMAGCRICLSTGSAEYEGFPNVLLQATAAGKPIVSLEDFDDYLARSGAGIHTLGDLDAAASAIRALYTGKRVVDGEQACQYLNQYHSVDTIIPRLLALLTE